MTSIKEQLKTLFTEHNYNKSYKKDDIVTHTVGENIDFYVAKQNVPRFVSIHSKGYWKAINNIEVKEKPQPTPTPTPTPTGDVDYLCFTAEKAGATLRMIGERTEGHEDDFALEYSTDGETWNEYEFTNNDGLSVGVTLTFNNIGDKVYFRGDNPKGTTDINYLMEHNGYFFFFWGGENTQPEDNEFAVTGDLQTLVDKTGQDKTAGCFYALFSGEDDPNILITSVPDLTATTLTDYCYFYLFACEVLLQNPADLSHIEINANNVMAISIMYDECLFKITSDNGVTLNGFGDVEYPINLVESEIGEMILNNYDFARYILGNIHGFNIATVYPRYSDGGEATSDGNYDYNPYWIPTNESVTATLTATPYEGYHFVKWQTSNDEGSTWADIPDATNTSYTVTLTQAGDYYYKAVFEQD